MKKKLIISIIFSILAPLLLVSILTGLVDFYNKAGFIYLALVINTILFYLTYYMFVIKKYRIFIPFISLLGIIYVLFVITILKSPYYALIGLLVIPCSFGIYYTKWLYVLYPIVVYPTVFNLYGVGRYTLELYLVVIILALAYSLWLRYHKTKIYLYDNYGD